MTVASCLSLVFVGCGVNNKTPEDTYKNLLENKENGNVDNIMKLISDKSVKAQKIDIAKLRDDIGANINNLKAMDFKIVNINITKIEMLDTETAIVIADIRYKTNDKQEVQVTTGDIAVFVKDADGWKMSPNAYVKTFEIGHKCNNSSKIEICIDRIRYYADEIDIDGAIENKNINDYSFGFASQSPVQLKLESGDFMKGLYPYLGLDVSPRIHKGKRNITFPIRENGRYYTIKSNPVGFQIAGILSMNGQLPAGFGDGLTVAIDFNRDH